MRVRVSYLSIKYKLQDYNFILKRLQRSCFHVNLRNFSEQLFIEHLRTTASAQWTILKILEHFQKNIQGIFSFYLQIFSI